jgi:hypothetical protein
MVRSLPASIHRFTVRGVTRQIAAASATVSQDRATSGTSEKRAAVT